MAERQGKSKIYIDTKLASSTISVALSVAEGGGVEAIQAFIVSKDKKAQRVFILS